MSVDLTDAIDQFIRRFFALPIVDCNQIFSTEFPFQYDNFTLRIFSRNNSRCSGQRGWNLKYRKGNKSLCVLYPMDGYFIVLVVIGNKELHEAEAYFPQASSEIQTLFAKTSFSAGGRWLKIPVTSERILEDVKNLIQIRVRSKQ